MNFDEYKLGKLDPKNFELYHLEKSASGEDGVTFILKDKDKNKFVFKIVPNKKHILLNFENDVASKVPLFARCYGETIFKINRLPEEWREKIETKKQTINFGFTLYGYVYEYCDIKIEEWIKSKENQTTKKLAGILFEVLYANYWAYYKSGGKYSHNDLHLDNIMLKSHKQPREYTVGKNTFIVSGQPIVKIIDFDRVTKNETTKKFVKGMRFFIKSLIKRNVFENWDKGQEIANQVKTIIKDKQSMEKTLTNEIFKTLIPEQESKKKRLKTTNCHICGGIAVRALENRPSLRFCLDDECVLKLGEIAHMI